MRGGLFPRHYINEKVEHVGFGQGGCDVRPLESASLVVLGVYPRAHGQFRDENVTALGKKNRRLRGDHFYFGVSFHDFLYAG